MPQSGTFARRSSARGNGSDTQLWIVSDHGHSAVRAHDDLAELARASGHRVLAHPWLFTRSADIAVMVSGNAMAHLYVELDRRERAGWSALRERWEPLVRTLLARESVDLVMLPLDDTRTEVRTRDRGSAHHRRGSRPLLVQHQRRRPARPRLRARQRHRHRCATTRSRTARIRTRSCRSRSSRRARAPATSSSRRRPAGTFGRSGSRSSTRARTARSIATRCSCRYSRIARCAARPDARRM